MVYFASSFCAHLSRRLIAVVFPVLPRLLAVLKEVKPFLLELLARVPLRLVSAGCTDLVHVIEVQLQRSGEEEFRFL